MEYLDERDNVRLAELFANFENDYLVPCPPRELGGGAGAGAGALVKQARTGGGGGGGSFSNSSALRAPSSIAAAGGGNVGGGHTTDMYTLYIAMAGPDGTAEGPYHIETSGTKSLAWEKLKAMTYRLWPRLSVRDPAYRRTANVVVRFDPSASVQGTFKPPFAADDTWRTYDQATFAPPIQGEDGLVTLFSIDALFCGTLTFGVSLGRERGVGCGPNSAPASHQCALLCANALPPPLPPGTRFAQPRKAHLSAISRR